MQRADGGIERFTFVMTADSHEEAFEVRKNLDELQEILDIEKVKFSQGKDDLIDDPFGDGR